MLKMLFFHNSDTLIKEFLPENAPGVYEGSTYYWFNTFHYHHAPWDRRYFHLFMKTPKDDRIRFFVRNGDEKYETLVEYHKEYIQDPKNNEPPILMSDSKIIPDLIAEGGPDASKETKVWKVVYPEQYAGMELKLYDDEHNPIPFNKVEGIKMVLGSLDSIIPFALPETYTEWNGASYKELRPEA